MKRIGLTASEEKSFDNVHDGRTPDASIYYKLTEPSAQVGYKLIINQRKSYIHRNLQHLPLSIWVGPRPPYKCNHSYFHHNSACSPYRVVLNRFSVCILMASLLLEVLCKPIISYFIPIFFTLISYSFELKYKFYTKMRLAA